MSDPRAKALKGGVLADDVWAAGYLGEIDGQNNPEDVWLTPLAARRRSRLSQNDSDTSM